MRLTSSSDSRSFLEEHLQGVDVVPRRKRLKRFAGLPMLKISAQDLFHGGVDLIKGKGLIDLPSAGGVFSEPAADENVIGLATIPRLRSEHADVAHVMLGAGIRTSREVNIDRLIEFDALLEIFDQAKSVALGVG